MNALNELPKRGGVSPHRPGVIASELATLAEELAQVVHHIIRTQGDEDFALDNFRDALVKASSVRLALQALAVMPELSEVAS